MRAFVAPDPPLSDGVVTLTVVTAGDAREFLAGIRDPAVAHFAWRRPIADEEAAREFLGVTVPRRMAAGEAIILAVRDGDELAGSVMLLFADWEQRVVEAGFWLAPAGRGRGLAPRAMRLLFDWAVDAYGFERVQAFTFVENPPAHRVLEAAGFVREGIMRGFERTADGSRIDQVSFARLSTDPG